MKYFYTDALAAAYMAKHYGMRFIDGCTKEELAAEDVGSIFHSKGYIHPDSYHILEPQADDVVELSTSCRPREVEDIYHVTSTHLWRRGKDTRIDLGGKGVIRARFKIRKIIQRQGKAFFMPEVES